MRQWLTEVDRQNWDVFHDLFAPDYTFHAPGAAVPLDRDQHCEQQQGFFQGFPDLRHNVEDLIAEGDKVDVKTGYSADKTPEAVTVEIVSVSPGPAAVVGSRTSIR